MTALHVRRIAEIRVSLDAGVGTHVAGDAENLRGTGIHTRVFLTRGEDKINILHIRVAQNIELFRLANDRTSAVPRGFPPSTVRTASATDIMKS